MPRVLADDLIPIGGDLAQRSQKRRRIAVAR